jgi:hypothetical protein
MGWSPAFRRLWIDHRHKPELQRRCHGALRLAKNQLVF